MTSQTQPSSQTSRPQGYLKEEFRFFHLKDLGKGPYEYHHHDFLKILILINGNVSYSIEGRSYRLMPWDMVLVDRGQIHRPEPDPSCPYERLILYLSPAFLEAHKHADSDLALCFHTASTVLDLSACFLLIQAPFFLPGDIPAPVFFQDNLSDPAG